MTSSIAKRARIMEEKDIKNKEFNPFEKGFDIFADEKMRAMIVEFAGENDYNFRDVIDCILDESLADFIQEQEQGREQTREQTSVTVKAIQTALLGDLHRALCIGAFDAKMERNLSMLFNQVYFAPKAAIKTWTYNQAFTFYHNIEYFSNHVCDTEKFMQINWLVLKRINVLRKQLGEREFSDDE